MIDIKEHTLLILGVAIATLLISTVMVPILTDTTGEMMAYRNNDEYVAMADLFDYDTNELESGDIVSCTILQDGQVHVDNTRGDGIVWDYYMPCPDVVAVWNDGAVINMGDSIGVVGFDLNNSRGFTNVKDANFTIHDKHSGIAMTLHILVYGASYESTNIFEIGEQTNIYLPAPDGDYAYYTLDSPFHFNHGTEVSAISYGNAGDTVYYSHVYWDDRFDWYGDGTGVDVYPYTEAFGGYFPTTGTNPHALTVMAESDIDVSYTAHASDIGPRVWTMEDISVSYTGGTNAIEMTTWILGHVKYSAAPEGAETIQTLVGIIPLLMLVALLMPITAVMDRERKAARDEEDER